MKATININGKLVLFPENQAEAFAAMQWVEKVGIRVIIETKKWMNEPDYEFDIKRLPYETN